MPEGLAPGDISAPRHLAGEVLDPAREKELAKNAKALVARNGAEVAARVLPELK